METANHPPITVETTVNLPVAKVWESWSQPAHITKWTNASPDWHSPYADNDLRKNGRFRTTMAAKDGSVSFDFEGVYTDVKEHELIEYTMGDGRKVKISFSSDGDQTKVTETFDPESTHPVDMQQVGWQSILDNFKTYTEKNF